MKKNKILILSMILMMVFFGCSKDNREDIYGTYTFDSIIYLSPLSSLSFDYLKGQMEGTTYTIEKDLFEIDSAKNNIKLDNPVYEKETIKETVIQAFGDRDTDSIPITKYEKKYRYSIYDQSGNKTGYYLYSMDNELWIASYTDNTADNTDIIMYLFKLK